ncbi:MAG: DUF5661 family protein [Terriglobia bacterium]
MDLPDYITVQEVRRVCAELGFRDWTELAEPVVEEAEAVKLLEIVNTKGMPVSVANFKTGLEVELEHGTRFDEANVTNNHPVVTAMIVLAHLNETLDYYERLDVAELEGDLLKAVQSGEVEKIRRKYRKLNEAREKLELAIRKSLGSA